ncbi:glycoside hydrolase family 15 protein [Spirosoma pulveris]
MLEQAFEVTSEAWLTLEKRVNYHGIYEYEVRNSLRALQQLTYYPSGGIIAAATTSLPEVTGGERNYDYRYVWMRDAALITGALVQLDTTGRLEQDFLGFIAGAMRENHEIHVSCFYAIDRTLNSAHRELPLSGYLGSRPVRVGNTAAKQFQLDAEANILLASKLIYDKSHEKFHWDYVVSIADFICKNWERRDNGIWEEEQQQHYTSSKAFAARGLELMADYQNDKAVAERWLRNARLIRQFIDEHCMTNDGAYAMFAGSQDVDVTTALFVPWGYDRADSKAMITTISRIEREYSQNGLYRRRLEEFDSSKEGMFLAASCWMSHYYSIAGDLHKAQAILEAVLKCSNDLGFFSEEADVEHGVMLGNFPQTFVHSSFICAVQGLQKALHGMDSTVR